MGKYQIIPDRQGSFDVFWMEGAKLELIASGFDNRSEAQSYISELIQNMRNTILGRDKKTA
jgi:hypothetical protein